MINDKKDKKYNPTLDRQVNPLGELVVTEVGPAFHIEVERTLDSNLNPLQKMFIQVNLNLLEELLVDHMVEPGLFTLVEHNKHTEVWSVCHQPHKQ